MDEYVDEGELSYQAILDRVRSFTSGDEDFDIFKCPVCHHIYLIEYEAETIFVAPDDLSALTRREGFNCICCGYRFDEKEPIIGPRADERYKVKRAELMASGWRWVLGR